MPAIVVKAIGHYELMNVPKPSPGPGEALVEVAVAGLCRTDFKIIEAGHRDLILPRIPAEEVAGTVCAVGSPADRNLAGQRVFVYPGTSCGACRACRAGAGNLCAEMRIMGFHRDGGFAQYVVSPVASLVEIPASISFEQAVFAEPLSCCLNALELWRLSEGEHIAIWGAGPAGTLLSRAAASLGAHPVVIEPDERRRDMIKGFICPPDKRFDVSIVAVGSAGAYSQAVECLAPRGRLVVFAGLSAAESRQAVDFNRLHYLEQTVVGAYGSSWRHAVQALNLIAGGRVRVADLISHRFPLRELGRALELVKRRQGMKIMIYPTTERKT